MTSKELLACITDRPCGVCKFHKENGCCKWTCVFDEIPEDDKAAISYRDGYKDGFAKAKEVYMPKVAGVNE